MSRKAKIEAVINEYINVRKDIFTAIQNSQGVSPTVSRLNAKKQELVQTAFNLLSEKEQVLIYNGFAEIIENKIPGCSAKEMKSYLTQSQTENYFNCLELQKTEIKNLFTHEIFSRTTIVDLEDGILVCSGGYHNGECYQ